MKAILFSLVMISSFAFANDEERGHNKIPECSSVVTQCKAGGFEPGQHKKTGKGLWIDCVAVAANGKEVPGVKITQAEAKACLDARKAHKVEKHK